MRFLSFFIGGCSFALMGFAQSLQTVTLVFTSGSNSHKNYEAVIDDVSYFSENNSSGDSQQMSNGSGNTIWLNNFQPGKHSIKIYSIRNDSKDERTGDSPVYSSSFTVKEGLDTKIAVKSNGHVQFSEKQSNSDNEAGSGGEKNGDVNSGGKNIYSTTKKNSGNKINDSENDDFDKAYKNKPFTTASADEKNNTIQGNDNFNGHERQSSKRIDTAIVYSDVNIDNTVYTGKDSKRRSNGEIPSRKSNSLSTNQHTDNNAKLPMNEDQFHELYESVRNQWRPGQKMKTLINEFLNAEDNFSTAQAKQLIKLITEEGNRLKLAKAVYPCITDLENFSDLNNLLRFKTSRAELDKFVSEGGKD